MRLIEASEFKEMSLNEVFLDSRRRQVNDALVVDFLNDVSRSILRSKECRNYPDVITFGYFCRKSLIERYLNQLTFLDDRYGWGLAIHIAPANIPVNFAFSFVFGLLSGNNNLVKLPSTSWPQVELILSIFRKVAYSGPYDSLVNNCFIRTERNSNALKEAVAICDALIVWGGNSTVETFRQLPKKPRCVELFFPDRQSSLVINATSILDYDKYQLNLVALGFFNDTFLVDNNACSSPKRILWVGVEEYIENAKNIFWGAVNDVIESKDYQLGVIAKIDKYLDIIKSSESAKSKVSVEQVSEYIWLTKSHEDKITGRLGRYKESFHLSLDLALNSLTYDEQTLTYMGFDKKYIKTLIKQTGAIVDRVVPVGQALDIGLLWDGIDVLSRLSRIVNVR